MKKRSKLLFGVTLFLSMLFFCFTLTYADNTAVTKGWVPLNGQWQNHILKQDYSYYHPIEITSAGELNVTFQSQCDSLNYVRLLDPDYIKISDHGISASPANPKTVTFVRDVLPGIYYIRFEHWNGNGGNYRLKATFKPANNNEKEPNNIWQEAQTIKPNQTVTGFLTQKLKDSSYVDEWDYYKFTLPKAQQVKFLYRPEKGNGIFNLYNSDMEKITRKWCYSTDGITYEQVLNAGTYYIGIETANKAGAYTIKASSGTNVSSIKLSGNKRVSPGNYFYLKATVSPSNATNKAVTWTSSNPSVATVYSNGKVYAKRPGYTRITATAKDGSGVKKYCTVLVLPSKMATPTAKNYATRRARINWTKQSYVSGYMVQYSTNSKFTNAKYKLLSKNYSGYTASNLSKRTYYTRVRAYYTYNGRRYYGPWSNVRTIRITK